MEKGKTPSLKNSAKIMAVIILVLWMIKVIELTLGLDLGVYGVYPRDINNLTGILTAPLIHGSFEHLFANTLPLFILGTALLFSYPKAAKYTLPIIYIGSGIGVWLFARDSYHIGASGLTHGLMFFLFVIGILRRDKPSIALALVVFFLYGGMIVTIFPTQENISFESHFFGALMGVLCAFLFRNVDTKPEEKKYSWEIDQEQQASDLNDSNNENNRFPP